jgi:glycosyltransferase involved in cell wall biosynthesis
MTISLCMIVKNEEDVLARCLDSVKDLTDEIIITDTGSTDRTVEIAQRYTDQVYSFEWVDDFSAARNFSFSKARMQYCLWLDADDIFLQPDREAFRQMKETLSPDTDVVMLPYHAAFDEQGKPSFSYYRERLLRRTAGFQWKGAVHEAVEISGKIVYGQAAVTHRKLHPGDPDRNLRIFERQLASGISLSPREQFYYARELSYHGRDQETIALLEPFVDSGQGWVENSIEACRLLAGCYDRENRPDAALGALLKSLRFDVPRAEVCCDIGRHFFDRCAYRQAIYWYEQALACKRDDTSGAFVLPDCYGYLPYLQLCICYDRMGEHQKARLCNDQAEQCRPGTEACRFNREYFSALLDAEG